MAIDVGTVAEGKVTGITRYGAFVTLADNTVGMVHISEISYQYVNDIHDVLEIGQQVKVKVVNVDENGRVSFSIKKATPPPPRPAKPAAQPVMRKAPAKPQPEEMTFEDKLKEFMQSSDSRISDLKHYNDRKTGSRRGRR
ncbi:MAG: S1 RNA-binding domain-containing protein [Clostridiaceae bacterium]|nr:S1 RNA-binding domain-containing protein [Clostridiaceae bacterium]MDD6274472.1 S1 RNA-binding domain-containing protein [Clostridiaceae bacterium]